MRKTGFWQIGKGSGRYEINLYLFNTGQGIQALLIGGEKPHVGGVVLAIPRQSLENNNESSGDYYVLPIPGHKDTVLGEIVAKILVENFKVPVSVTAGVHSDNLTIEEITRFSEDCRNLVFEAVRSIGEVGWS